MKIKWLLVAISAFIGAVWLSIHFFMASPVTEPPVNTDSRAQPKLPKDTELAEKIRLAEEHVVAEVEDSLRPQLQQQVKLSRAEIEQQIALLNENIYNPDERREIQRKLKILMNEYNQAALPIALEKMTKVQ